MSTQKREHTVTFCERLKSERKRLGISQDELAEVAGVTRKSVVNYESGFRVPDATFLAKIAQVGADVTYILTGVRTGEEPPLPNKGMRGYPEVGAEEVLESVEILARSLITLKAKVPFEKLSELVRVTAESFADEERKKEGEKSTHEQIMEKVKRMIMLAR